jgi:hypothetical protein
MKAPDHNIMPAVIVIMAMLGFYAGGGYILYKSFNPTEGSIIENAKALSLLDMVVIAAIGLVSGSSGYWLGATHGNQRKDEMLLNSAPLPPTSTTPVTTAETMTTKTTTSAGPPETGMIP